MINIKYISMAKDDKYYFMDYFDDHFTLREYAENNIIGHQFTFYKRTKMKHFKIKKCFRKRLEDEIICSNKHIKLSNYK